MSIKKNLNGLVLDVRWVPQPGTDEVVMYRYLVDTFFFLYRYPRPLSPSTASSLVKFQFRVLHRLFASEDYRDGGEEVNPDELRRNVILFNFLSSAPRY